MKARLWIARDKNGELWLYDSEPTRYETDFGNNSYNMKIDKNSHKEITWDNSPQEIYV